MWRKTACAGAGLIAACAAATLMPSLYGLSSARSESFEARWLTATGADPAKQDRLAPPRGGPSTVFWFNMPGSNTTIATKHMRPPEADIDRFGQAGNRANQRPAFNPVRDIPSDSKRKEKLPVGCDPVFSPVAVPTMAHISGRCLS